VNDDHFYPLKMMALPWPCLLHRHLWRSSHIKLKQKPYSERNLPATEVQLEIGQPFSKINTRGMLGHPLEFELQHWLLQQHGDRCFSAESVSEELAKQRLWPQRARLWFPFMPNHWVSAEKETECRAKVMAPTFSRTKTAKIAVLADYSSFGYS